VGDVDYVVFAPEGRSVEDLARHEIMSALRDKTPYSDLLDEEGPAAAVGDDSAASAPTAAVPTATASATEADPVYEDADGSGDDGTEPTSGTATASVADGDSEAGGEADVDDDRSGSNGTIRDEPSTLRGHVRAVIEAETGSARLLDDTFETIETVPATGAFDAVSAADRVPYAVVLDGELTQRMLDVAAQRGVEQFVARSSGEMVKTPVDVRVRTVDQLAAVD
jgi:DNA primase